MRGRWPLACGPLVATLVASTGCEPGAPTVEARTFALPSPEGGEPAFEPHLSLDPTNPDRILVAAHYGVGYNRGGKRIWTWQSSDGGTTWDGVRMPLPNEAAALAADAVTGFDERGRGYVGFLFADTTGRRFDGGAALAVTTEATGMLGPARTFVTGGLEHGGAIDKDWIAFDRSPTSPFRGSVYLSWHRNVPDFATGTVASSFWVAASRDGGASVEPERLVADAFSGQVAVRRDGTVDAIFAPSGEAVLLHAASVDGARTFSPPDTIAVLVPTDGPRPATPLDVPALLAHGDSLLACWSASQGADSTRFTIRCAASRNGTRWEPPAAVLSEGSAPQSLGFPALASGAGATWLLAYQGDSSVTRVVLFRSDDGGRHWTEFRELARRSLGMDRFCLAAGAPCRRADPGTMFFPGDYFGLDAGHDRLAAAFVLPAEDRPDALPTVYVSLVRP